MTAKKVQAAYEAHHAALKLAFELVQNQDDWKAPIDARISLRNEKGEPLPILTDQLFSLIREAVIHYTGTSPDILTVDKDGVMRVTAIGYRAGPCGP